MASCSGLRLYFSLGTWTLRVSAKTLGWCLKMECLGLREAMLVISYVGRLSVLGVVQTKGRLLQYLHLQHAPSGFVSKQIAPALWGREEKERQNSCR